MAIIIPGQAGAIDHIDSTQQDFRDQVAEVTRSVLRLGGADFDSSSTTTLYVNQEIGSDRFVSGIEDVAASPPLTKQQLTCGYFEAAPFRTLQRALIEAARLSIQRGAANDLYDRILIKVAAGELIIDNAPSTDLSVSSWGDEYDPSEEDLRAFNSASLGVILPRGVSIIGADLRKSVIRPAAVPAADGSQLTDRGSIFKTTGGSFFFNFTFKDALTVNASHHLLSAFAFCPEAELAAYYDKIAVAFGITPTDAEIANPGETQITTFYPDSATAATDSTKGSSGYVFNCSLRSDYGMCGMYLDGSLVTGFKSMVVAQFTIVSLQRDMNAWQIYSGTNWVTPANYQEYIDADSNNIRSRISGAFDNETGCYSTDYRHFGFKLINNAFVQEVSCFIIGAAVNHWTASGGECTITNSNSNFGMTALLSSGFRGIGTTAGAFIQDRNFECLRVKRAQRIATDGSNIRRIGIGTVAAYDSSTGVITLESAFDPDLVFGQYGYTLKGGDYIWIDNRLRDQGPGAPNDAVDVHAVLTTDPFDSAQPTKITVNTGTDNNFDTIASDKLVGSRVYIRRLVDTRTPEERQYSLIVSSTAATSRRPVGNYIVRLGNRSTLGDQLDPSNNSGEIFIVSEVNNSGEGFGSNAYRMLVRPGDSASSFNSANYYRVGTPVSSNNRVYRSKRNDKFDTLSTEQWEPSLAMLPDVRGVELLRISAGPTLLIDADLDSNPDSTDLGINQSTYTSILQQIRSSTDFLGVALLMRALGYSAQDVGNDISNTLAGTILELQTEVNRLWDPSDAGSATPSGKLTARENWPLEFNRPSLIRAFGHAYEFVGYGNYVKAMPKYQTKPLSDQNKVDYFGVNLLGGRVYNTGFNEDGLLVQGNVIFDLATQKTVNTEIAGLGGLSGDPDFPAAPETVEQLTVTDRLASSTLTELTGKVLLNGTLEGSIVFGDGVLPTATDAVQGIVELATSAEVAEYVSDRLAVTPAALGDLRGAADGLCDLDGSSKIPVARIPDLSGQADLLPTASATAKGLVELATPAETLALTDTTRAVTPQSLTGLRGVANGLASLDGSGDVPLAQLPLIPTKQLDLAPVTWTVDADNFANSANFNYQETTDGATINLGTPQLSGYEGTSGFIVVTRGPGVTTLFTDIDDAAWRGIANTWIDPQTSVAGLDGEILIGYYIASDSSIIYTASKLS